ncbi:MAG: hypothetical protein A3G93_06455 [Nitrospinae bacterium RIFCSPLOWO2_12_FULL_45_22]|nr:MAG: hypothetical protein A3G93_06455 [Nitrospinae bacterium RIFCSPLOWO2_12_FULL_45_22]
MTRLSIAGVGNYMNWSELQKERLAIRKQFPNFWRLKVIKNVHGLIAQKVKNGENILDIGAYDRSREVKLKQLSTDIFYRSMDTDRANYQDYYCLEEIKETFNIILLLEVIEHLPLEEGLGLLGRVFLLLNKGGWLILSTPNLYHPTRFWDISHKTPYRYDELGGLILSLGYQIEGIYRVYNAPFIPRLFRLYLAAPLHRYLGIDFARSILIVGRKPL